MSSDTLALLTALASGQRAKTETDLQLSYNAKSVPDGSSSSQSSPGSPNQTPASNTPALAQGQAFTITVVPGSPPTVSTSSGNSYDEDDIAVKVNGSKPQKCPDMSQYVRKDSIPCWGCKL
jgi:hypothetical protein